MSATVTTVHRGERISKLRSLFREQGVHHLPVASGRELLGIVSWTDLMRVSFGDAFNTDERAVDATLDHTMTIEQLMNKSPVTLRKDATIRNAAEILSTGEFHALPIVEADGKTLVGMVTSTDLIRYLLAQL